MSMFKRMSATLVTRMERIVDDLEDHDAVVAAALSDLQKQVAKSRARYTRVEQEGANLAAQLVELQSRARQWRSRAVQSGRENQATALECLARARQADEDAIALEERIGRHREAASRLGDAMKTMEKRFADLRRKQVLMRARESTGRALSAGALGDNGRGVVVDDVMERWETKVLETEMAVEVEVLPDPLEKSFADRELKADLERELKALLEGGQSDEC